MVCIYIYIYYTSIVYIYIYIYHCVPKIWYSVEKSFTIMKRGHITMKYALACVNWSWFASARFHLDGLGVPFRLQHGLCYVLGSCIWLAIWHYTA